MINKNATQEATMTRMDELEYGKMLTENREPLSGFIDFLVYFFLV